MKVCILGDLHFGCRKGNHKFIEYQLEYLTTVIDFCVKNRIDTIIQTGDFFDSRQFTNNWVLNKIKNWFKDKCISKDICWYVIIGNHDIYHRDDNTINMPSILSSLYPNNFFVFDDVDSVYLGNDKFTFCPWIHKNNQDEILSKLNNINHKASNSILISHLELMDFSMYKGVISKNGLDYNLFKNFDLVISGHYHTISNIGNIHYVGSPYHLTWMDYLDGNNRGFWILDSVSLELKLYKNNTSLFSVLEYDKNHKYTEKDVLICQDKILKVIITDKGDTKKFNKFKELLNNTPTIQIDYIDNSNFVSDKVEIKEETLKLNMLGTIFEYIDKQEKQFDKDSVKIKIQQIYQEAL